MVPNTWMYIALAALAACAVFVVLFVYNRREQRRHRAFHAAAQFTSLGLERIGHLLEQYAIGDYSGLAESIHALHRDLEEPGGVYWLLGDALRKALPNLLVKPEWLAFVKDELAKIEPPTVTAVQAAATPGVAAAVGPKPA